jgi:hypothetical protein
MNRRSFFATLALAAPLLFLPKLEPPKWKRDRVLWVPNPEYVKAPFEIRFIDQPGLYDQVIFKKDSADVYGYLHERHRIKLWFDRFPEGKYPTRYTVSANPNSPTIFEPVPPFIRV